MALLSHKGFAGRQFEQLVAGHGARLLRPDRKDEPDRHGSLGRWRQWIESTFDTLKDQLGLERHGGRTLAGVWVRVGQRLLALAAAIWWNGEIDAAGKRSLVAYDHLRTHPPNRKQHLATAPPLRSPARSRVGPWPLNLCWSCVGSASPTVSWWRSTCST